MNIPEVLMYKVTDLAGLWGCDVDEAKKRVLAATAATTLPEPTTNPLQILQETLAILKARVLEEQAQTE